METCTKAAVGIGWVPTLMGTIPEAMVSPSLEIIPPPFPPGVR